MSEMHDVFTETAARIFAQASTEAEGLDTKVWEATTESGLDRLLLSEDAGGAGDAFDVAVALARVLGAHAPAIPFIETLLANWCLERAGLEIPDGPKTLYVPLPDEATQSATPLRLNWVDAHTRIVTITAVDAQHTRVNLLNDLPRGVRKTNLAVEPVLLVAAQDLRDSKSVGGESKLALQDVLAVFAALKAAAMVGAMETVLAMTIEYANSRMQFGKRIGAFQAIQHLIARMAEETAAAAASVEKAARTLGQTGGTQSQFAAAVAKARAGDAAFPVVSMAHQCHGAIGFTHEYVLHRFTTRALAWRDDAGSADYWNGRIGAAALQRGAAGLWAGLTEGSLL